MPVLFVLTTLVSATGLAVEVPETKKAARPRPDGPLPDSEFRLRRDRVLAALREQSPEGAVLFLRAPETSIYSNDIRYPYRTDSDLYYLTGLRDPGVALLLSTETLEPHGHQVLFTWPAPSEAEVLWNGPRLAPTDASRISGIARNAVLDPEEIETQLGDALGLKQHPHIPYAPHPPIHPSNPSAAFFFETGPGFTARQLPSPGYAFLLDTFGSTAFHLDLRSSAAVIAPLRQIKSAHEIAMIEKACDATCNALKRAARLARPGVFERDLAAVIESTFRRQGTSGWSFPSIVGSGPNSCVLHHQQYDRELESGDLVLMDVGAEYRLYAADITRTVPVSGTFSPRQRQIYDIVFNAQREAMEILRPGLEFKKIHETAKAAIARDLVEIGLIANESEVRKYFPHGTSHGLGINVHDAMPLTLLEAGMVVTVEPGIYIPEENIGIRIEDDVLITDDGFRILSDSAPRAAKEVERWMRTARF
jgi:Xaa-Pro aminopeptidase